MMKSVGIVLGSKEKNSEALEFWVGVSDENYLQLDDVVFVQTPLPGSDDAVKFYGTVQYVTRFFEGAEWDSDSLRAAQGTLPVNLAYAAKIAITRVNPEIYIPPRPGDPVYRAEGKELEAGLFIDKMERKVPAGILRTGEPYFLNFDFLNGENGAHLSISGISGVATKTTYGLFLLYGILNSGLLGTEASNTHALIFNVKGEDLLFLDKRNSKLSLSEEKKYERLGLPASSFRDAAFYSPPRADAATLIAATERRQTGISTYMWTLRQIAKQRLFSFFFTDTSDERSDLLTYIRMIEGTLYKLAADDKKPDWEPLIGSKEQELNTLFDLHDDVRDNPQFWFKDFATHSGQVQAVLRRIQTAAYGTEGLVRQASEKELKKTKIHWEAHQLTVVDIHQLSSAAKMFVVGSLLRTVFREKEAKGTSRPLLLVMIDELNKYAPREGWSPIKDVIHEISERGRSLGVILFGAQQTASEVESRVITNCSIKAIGRMDSAEVEKAEYGFLGKIFKQRAKLIAPGTMILNQPTVPTPVLVNFPFPAWATRPDEVQENEAEDPFTSFDQE
jgi:DNA helicase HerA-like ATPase